MPIHLFRRSLSLCLGLIILSFGITFSIRSNLGTSPVSSIPYVYSYIVPLSVGTITVIFHALMIFFQYLVLREKFHWTRSLQLGVGLILGVLIDLTLLLTQSLQPTTYAMKLFFCLLSCMFTATAIILILKANLILLAIEGLYQAVSVKFNLPFARCKMLGDIALVAVALISSLYFIQDIVGLGEGTIICALLVGTLIKWFMPYFQWIDDWIYPPAPIKKPHY